ncbi:MAG: hypothetical protein IID61_15085, partial [SAR324 cluster bacterium]|nr:hypothetical protein [SAR324 cluster bacterium]
GAGDSLQFDYFLDTEASFGTDDGILCNSGLFDCLTVEISTDSGATWTRLEELPTSVSGFTFKFIGLSFYSGLTVLIRFNFDTGDEQANFWEGAYIDDIFVGP